MTEADWLAATDPSLPLQHLTHKTVHATGQFGALVPRDEPLISQRKLRLFTVACCRAILWKPCARCKQGNNPIYAAGVGKLRWHAGDDKTGVVDCPDCGGTGRIGTDATTQVINTAERFADGTATRTDLEALTGSVPGPMPDVNAYADLSIANRMTLRLHPGDATHNATHNATAIVDLFRMHNHALMPTCAALLREIAGNPHQPTQFLVPTNKMGRHQQKAIIRVVGHLPEFIRQSSPKHATWYTTDIRKFADTIYHDNRWTETGVLADALEDAGCYDDSLLAHLRNQEQEVIRCPKKTCHGGLIMTNAFGTRRHQECRGTGYITNWRQLRTPHIRGCWAIDLLTKRK